MMTNKNIPICSVISWLLVLLLFVVGGRTDDDEPISNIIKLRKDLIAQYDKYARPVRNSSTSVPVSIDIEKLELVELNEFEEKMVLDAVVIMTWVDEHLKWDPSKYNGIDEMVFTQDEIWHPDVILFDSVPTTNNLPWNNTHMNVISDGSVFWHPPARICVRCHTSLLKPMEERTCNVSMASYSHFKHELDLKIVRTEYGKNELRGNNNPVWNVMKMSAYLRTLSYDTLEYSIVVFTLQIKRRYDFVSDVVRGPRTVAILLTLAMFWLPSTSDKKLNLGCLVLLVLTGIILYLSSTVISPSLLAVTVAPLRITLFTITSALLIEVIIINLSRLSDIVRPPPVLVRILSGMVGRVIGVCSRLEYKEDGGMVRLPETEEEETSQPTISIEEEWALVAMALDRVFFVIYAVIFVIVS